jgi:hypothetical protein
MATSLDQHGNSSGIAQAELPCRLLNLPAEMLVAISAQLAEDDELAPSLACRKLREAVARTERRMAGARLSTRIASALSSAVKLEWAASCGIHAMRHGQLESLRWLCAHGCAWEPLERWLGPEDLRSSAAQGGHLSALQWARANGCPWGKTACMRAAEGGHLAVLQWARANGCPWCASACTAAARGGHLAVLQ